MSTTSIEQSFREKVNDAIRLEQEGLGRFRVLTPFSFDDGDRLVIILGRELSVTVPGEDFGDALYSFVQAILRISDVALLRCETVR